MVSTVGGEEMALSGDDALALAKSYVRKTAEGLGAVKGKDGFSPIITEDPANTETDYRLDITTESNSFKTPNLKGGSGEDGFSPTITENPENDTNTYRLDITNKDGSFTTPNLKGKDGTIGGGEAVGNDMVWYPTVSSDGEISWEKAETDVPPIPVNVKGTPGENGLSPTITENPDNTDSVYKLDIVTAEGEFTTPNLKGFYGGTICKNDGSPVGEIISFMGTHAPEGYLVCDGSIYQIADYPYLAQHFADNFGSANFFGGDGIATFAIPDLQGEFLRGAGKNSRAGQGSGSQPGQHQDATKIPTVLQHKENQTFLYTPGNGGYRTVYNQDSYPEVNKEGYNFSNLTHVNNNDNRTPYFTPRPTNTSVLYCIRYIPTFPEMNRTS